MHWILRACAVFSLALALVGLSVATPALAHERREVGKYTFVVGFLNEPAYQDVVNGIDLRISNTETKEPVAGAEKTLNAVVIAGGKELPLKIRAVFGKPGSYAADFIPTRAGQYVFRFTGAVEGQNVDQRFESGPGRFEDIQSTTAVQFPDKAPAGAQIAQDLANAQAAAQQAQTVGYAGVGLGVLGLILGIAAFLTRPRTAPSRPLAAAGNAGADD